MCWPITEERIVTNELKIGDRVRVTEVSSGMDAKVGQVGTALQDGYSPWVVFDEPTGYGADGSDIEGWKADHMDCVASCFLELVPAEQAPEWDGVFRVGDKGVTRGGESYIVTSTSEVREYFGHEQPISAVFDDNSAPGFLCADGSYLGYGESDFDLMPPTGRGVVVDTTHAANAAILTRGVECGALTPEHPSPFTPEAIERIQGEAAMIAGIDVADDDFVGSFMVKTITNEELDAAFPTVGVDVAALMQRVAELEADNAGSSTAFNELIQAASLVVDGWEYRGSVDHVIMLTLRDKFRAWQVA
jgi:hypothetical protein